MTSFQQRTRRAFVWVLLIPIALAVLSFWAAGRYRNSIFWVSHAKDALVAVDDLLVTLTNAESNQRGFLLTGGEPFRLRYIKARDQVAAKLATLRQLTTDNPEQQANLNQLSSAIEGRLKRMEQVLALRSKGRLPEVQAVEAMYEGAALMQGIRQTCSMLTAEETRLLAQRSRVRQRTEIEVGICFTLVHSWYIDFNFPAIWGVWADSGIRCQARSSGKRDPNSEPTIGIPCSRPYG